MSTYLAPDLLQIGDSVAPSREQMDELKRLYREGGLRDRSLPDHDGLVTLQYNEKLTDEGTEGHFLWGNHLEVYTHEHRIAYKEFKRKFLNTLPMLKEADEKRGYMMRVRLASQRTEVVRKKVNTYLRHFKGIKPEELKLALYHIRETLDTLNRPN